MAPEYFQKDISITKVVDIWALGAIFYFLKYKKLPFKSNQANFYGTVDFPDSKS